MARVSSIRFLRSSGREMSALTACASPPAARMRATVSVMVPGRGCSLCSTVRAETTTLAPSMARRRAIASPMPRLAPVTTATRPASVPFGLTLGSFMALPPRGAGCCVTQCAARGRVGQRAGVHHGGTERTESKRSSGDERRGGHLSSRAQRGISSSSPGANGIPRCARDDKSSGRSFSLFLAPCPPCLRGDLLSILPGGEPDASGSGDADVVGVDEVEEGLAGGVAAQVLEEELGAAFDVEGGGGGGVGGDDDVGQGPEFVLRGGGLGLEDVEGGAGDATLAQGGEQGGLVYDGAAGDVDEVGGRLHAGELGGADGGARGAGERRADDEVVGAGAELAD